MLAQIQFEHEAMVVRQPSMQRIVQDLGRRLDTPVGQRRQLVQVSDARDHRLDHPPSAYSQNVADHRVELDVGLFERLLDPLDMAGLLAGQLLACAQQRTQFLGRLVRNEARPDQPAGQQIGDPCRVVHVGLSAGHVLDVRRIGDDQLECAVAQDVPDRLPVDAGRLHRHVRAARCRQPVQQRLKAGRRCLERPALALDLSLRHDPHTGNDLRLVDVQAGNPLMHDFHLSLRHTRTAGVGTSRR